MVLHFLMPWWRERVEQWVWGWAVGLGLFGVVQFFAAHLFIFGPQVAILLYFVGLASWAIVYQQDKKSLVVLGHAISRGCSKPWILLALVLAFVVVIGCATPPLFWDSNVYHLARPMQYLLWGGAEISAHHTFSANPLLMELALSPVLILSFDPVHMNVAHSMGLFLLMASVTLFTKRFLTEKSYSIAAISLLAMPVVVFAGGKSFIYSRF